MTAVIPAPTLYGLSQEIVALVDTIESLDPNDQQAHDELQTRLTETLTASKDKVDAFVSYLNRCDVEAGFCKAEAVRLRAAAEEWEARQARLKRYARIVIENLPRVGKKDAYARLEGHASMISLRAGRSSVDVFDESVVPLTFKTLTLTAEGAEWGNFLGTLSPEDRERLLEVFTDTSARVKKDRIKVALEGLEAVPGAQILFGEPIVIAK